MTPGLHLLRYGSLSGAVDLCLFSHVIRDKSPISSNTCPLNLSEATRASPVYSLPSETGGLGSIIMRWGVGQGRCGRCDVGPGLPASEGHLAEPVPGTYPQGSQVPSEVQLLSLGVRPEQGR